MTQQVKNTKSAMGQEAAVEIDVPPKLSTRLPSPGPFQLIALDLEGTLLRPDRTLSKRCVEVIRSVQSRGANVVLAAGYAPAMLAKFYQHLGLKAPQICFNGALVYDPVNHQIIFHDPIDPFCSERVVRVARSIDNKVTIKVEIVDQRYVDDIGTNPGLSTTAPDAYHTCNLGQLGKVISEPVTKIGLTSSPQSIARIRRQLDMLLPNKLRYLVSEPHALQILNCGVGKGTALMQIADYLRVDPDNVLAMGDGLNDIEMINWAGMGVAMGNAHRTVKEAAHFVGPSNAEDGVAVVLSKYVLRS